MRRTIATGLFVLAVAAGAHAADEGPWSGKAGLGYLATSGNSETTNVSASAAVNYDLERWHHEAFAGAIGAESDGTSTAEAYRLGYKAKYDFTKFDYIFGRIAWDKDKFSSYDQQISETIGYGRRVINSATQVLNLEIGAGFKQNDLIDGTSEDDAIVRAAGDYLWKFSDTAKFVQTLAVEAGESNTFIESVSQVNARLMENTALVLGYTVKNNSDVVPGTEKTDTFTSISLEYAF